MNFNKTLICRRFLTSENIRNHFIGNPEWEEAFKKCFTIESTTPENYPQRAYEVFTKNGYEFEEIRPYKSDKFKTIVHIAIHKDGEWLCEYGDMQEWNAFEQVICQMVDDYDLTYNA